MSLFGQSDITRAARSMIRDFGRRAAEKAAQEASKASQQERGTAAAEWKRIEREIERLLAENDR